MLKVNWKVVIKYGDVLKIKRERKFERIVLVAPSIFNTYCFFLKKMFKIYRVFQILNSDLRPSGPKRPMRRLLKKEVSLDTYTWQKKYGHLTSSIMMAAVDERLKRRFSVSASMEEISKIPSSKDTMGSQVTNLFTIIII